MRRPLLLPGALILLASCLALLAGCGGANDHLLLLDEMPQVGTVTIRGTDVFEEKTLKELMVLKESSAGTLFRSTRYSEHQFRTDVLAILTYYVRHGYLRARLVDRQVIPNGEKVDLVLTVFEGEPTSTAGVRIYAAEEPSTAPLVARGIPVDKLRESLVLAPGEPFDPLRLEDDRRRLLAALADRGYMLARVRSNVQFQGDQALVFFRVDPGDAYTVSAVDIEGFRSVKERFVRSDLEIKRDELYNLKKISNTQENLLRSGYFNYVRWDTLGVDPGKQTVSLRFRVRERKMQWIEGGVGINDSRQLRLTTVWGSRSLLGSGLRFAVRNRAELDLSRSWADLVDRNLLELIFNKQNFMGWHWDLQPNGYWEYVRSTDYRQNIYGAAITGRHFLGRSRKNQIVLSVENRWVYNQADSLAQIEDPLLAEESYQTRLLVSRLARDSRNDFFAPTRGSYQRLTVELAGGVLGGNNGFRKATGTMGQFFQTISDVLIFAWRLEAGSATPTTSGVALVSSESELIPPEDRYKLGGAYTVRGFTENDLDGRTDKESTLEGGVVELLGNLELRGSLGRRFAVVAFLDAGNVWQDSKDLGFSRFVPHSDPEQVDPLDVRYAYGLGLRFTTPVGPIRLDYARKWNIPAEFLVGTDPEDKSRIHLALGHAF